MKRGAEAMGGEGAPKATKRAAPGVEGGVEGVAGRVVPAQVRRAGPYLIGPRLG